MSNQIKSFLRNKRGSTAAEFAMVLPILILFLLGMTDVGRFMWTMNRAEKASQMGVRFASVTDTIPSGLKNYDFSGTAGLTSGDIVPATAYSTMTCSKTDANAPETCACVSGGSCPWGTSVQPDAFSHVVNQMAKFLPEMRANNLQVAYVPSGLGYAGDPNGSDISPLVRVTITGLKFRPFFLFGAATLTLPDISASLTMEDGSGSFSN